MIVDWSKVVGLSTEKGSLRQIADASGRVLWKKKEEEANYVPLEYIQSIAAVNTSQYIYTGVKPNQNTRIVLSWAHSSAVGTNVAGVRNAATDSINRFGIITMGSSKKIGAYFGQETIQAIDYDSDRHVYDLSKSGLIVDGVDYGGANSEVFSCTHNLTLCAWNNGADGIQPQSGKLYSCKIYDNGKLVRNFIPCKKSNDVDGEVGLYDAVEAKFYPNAGTGIFIAGPVAQYEQLAYIESTGTQYIDTGYSAANGFIVDADFTFASVSTSFGYIIGSHNLNEPYGRNGVGNNAAFYWEIGTGDTCPAATVQPVTGTRYAIQASTVKGNSYLRVDGTEFIATTDATVRSSENLLIFTNQYQEAFGSGTTCGKLYSLKIYSPDNVLVRDFIPCRNSEGIVGLYDNMHMAFYTNEGSGEFIGASKPTANITFSIYGGGAFYDDKREDNANYAYATIDGVKVENNSTMEVELGKVITFHVKYDADSWWISQVEINGDYVFSAPSPYTWYTYDYVVTRDAKVTMYTGITSDVAKCGDVSIAETSA